MTELADVPFASKVRTEYNGQEVGVMHACGHDVHTAVLMGAAEVLAGMRDRIPGTVKFIFQPAEEGSPAGERGGASLMIEEGALENPRPDVIFGLHTGGSTVGTIRYRQGGIMASAQSLMIKVMGSQTHGASPWEGVDPIVVASQIVLGLQTIISRQSDLSKAAAVITIGSIHGGLRSNIIPDSVMMVGTIRTLDPDMQALPEEQHTPARSRRLMRASDSIPSKSTREVLGRRGWSLPEIRMRGTDSSKMRSSSSLRRRMDSACVDNPSRASSAARPKATMPGTFSVPARHPNSWSPPCR